MYVRPRKMLEQEFNRDFEILKAKFKCPCKVTKCTKEFDQWKAFNDHWRRAKRINGLI